MTTFLLILLAVLVVFNIWLAIWTAKLERERRRKYQDRIDECDERIGEVVNELGKAKQCLNEANSAKAALKKSFEETIKEYEKLQRDYRKLQDDFEAYKQGKDKPIDLGEPTQHGTPGEASETARPKIRKGAKKAKKA